MKLMVKSALALSFLIVAIGCGGSGGSGGPTGTLCKAKANPIPVNLKGGQIIDLDPAKGEITALPGTYRFVSSEVFYKQTDGPMIHIREGRARKDNKPATSILCAGGFTSKTAEFRKRVMVVSSLEVGENNRVTFKVRDYLIGFADKILKEAADADAGGFDSPKKVYDDVSTSFAFYKSRPKDDTLFETRSVITRGDESISTIVRYKRCGFNGKACPPELPQMPFSASSGQTRSKEFGSEKLNPHHKPGPNP